MERYNIEFDLATAVDLYTRLIDMLMIDQISVIITMLVFHLIMLIHNILKMCLKLKDSKQLIKQFRHYSQAMHYLKVNITKPLYIMVVITGHKHY
jgi:hypothetical protein